MEDRLRHPRRRPRAAALALAFVSSCGSAAFAATEVPVSQDARRLAQGSNAFGFDLYARLRATRGNLVVSPASVSTALTMTWGGARGATAEQMARVMHLEGTPAAVLPASGRLAAMLQDPARPLVFRIANRLFGEKSAAFESAYLQATKAAFGAGLEPVDFKGAPEKARVFINGWVEEQTEKRIRDLIPPGAVNADTRLALVNAIYFLGDWAEPFEKNATRPRPFHVTPTTPKDVPTMHRLATLRFAPGEGRKALELPYKGDQLSMVLVLPDALDGLDALEAALTPAAFDALVASLKPTRVSVALPKFEIDPAASLALADLLQAMGMRLAFDREKADFTGIAHPKSPADRLYLARVYHKAFVKVDEKGTEAAAATAALMMRAGSMPPVEKPAEFKADHPFLFFIRDKATGLVVFMGRVADPGAR
jgi:serpin B